MPRRPFRWELHKLRATVKEAVRDSTTSPKHGSVAATLALALRGPSSPRRRGNTRGAAPSPRAKGHLHSRSAVPTSHSAGQRAAVLKDSKSGSDRGVRAAARAHSGSNGHAAHRRVRDLRR